QFIEYLEIEKNAAKHTVLFYRKDIEHFFEFLQRENVTKLDEVSPLIVRIYLTELYKRKLSRKSVSRLLSCLRTFYMFMERENQMESNPFVHIPLPKQDKLIPDFFYAKELEELFSISDQSTVMGQRNQAILEVLYATGIRVSERRTLTLGKIDFSTDVLIGIGKGQKQRYIPFGQSAKHAL